MQACKKCGVEIRGSHKRCPLCQGMLTGPGDESEEVFPVIPTTYRKYNLFFRLSIFFSIVAAVICVAVNIMVPSGGGWSAFVVAAIACMWMWIVIVVRKRNNLHKSILWQVFAFSMLAVLWDFFTRWRGWSIDYVVPILCVVAMAAMGLIARVMRLHVADYMIYMIIDAIFGSLPVLFLALGWVHVVYPSVICVAGSVISLAALLTFEGENMLLEIRKRLHL